MKKCYHIILMKVENFLNVNMKHLGCNSNFKFISFVRFYYVTILFLLAVNHTSGIRWLSLHSSTINWTEPSSCWDAHDSGALTSLQLRTCRRHPDVMSHVVQAARYTRDYCLGAHSLERWNCSSIDKAPHYTPELLTGTREQAYVYAMSSAALVWSVARACAAGSLAECSCATPPLRPPRPPKPLPQPRARFKWGGCGDNFKWADRFAKQFIDAYELNVKNGIDEEEPDEDEIASPEPETTTTSTTVPPSVILVDDQPQTDNTSAPNVRKRRPKGRKSRPRRERRRKEGGRSFLMRKIEYRMAADDPRFDPMVDLDVRLRSLKQLIATANLANGRYGRKTVSSGMHTRCTCHGVSGSCSVRTCWRALPPLNGVSGELAGGEKRAGVLRAGGRATRARPAKMLYVSPSPDYCVPSPNAGSVGTSGRPCNASLGMAAGGCGRLCCGRGRVAERTTRLERCRCRYEWCCRVKCETCRVHTVQHYCK